MSSSGLPLPSIPGYRLRKIIGRGGMATVFLAEQENTGGRVAIKVMRMPPGESNEWSARFHREAAILKKFDHPNIVRVAEVGENNGDHYIVMEYLDHGDLATWIRQGLQPHDALRLLRALALALDHAHRHGVVHRDVKPDNVLFRADGTAVLIDFGIAIPRTPGVRLTQAGAVMGTPAYMSPEQHQGLDADYRSDIYSMGIVLHEMLTRELPFNGNGNLALANQHLSEPAPRLPPTLAPYQRLLDSMLAKNPAERVGRGETIVKAIDIILQQPEPLAKKAIAANAAREAGLDVRKTTTKTGFFSKACDIAINIGAQDYESLQQHWSAATQELFEWDLAAGKSARNISIDFYVHPWILMRAKQFVQQLASSDDYQFLNERRARICIHDLAGVPEHEFVLGEPPEG